MYARHAIRPTADAFPLLRRLLPALPLLGSLVALLASDAGAQWTRQSPIPTYLDVRGVAAPTAGRVFVATDDNSFDGGGALFESVNGGSSWVQRNIPFSLTDPLNGIFFIDGQNGWAFGNANYRTTDGGATWSELPYLGSTYSMKFHSATFGTTVGNFGPMISRDGGASWEISPNGMFAFHFLDSQVGLGVSSTGIYRTMDGGSTFTEVHAGNATDALFLSSSNAVAIVNDTFVYSTNGGVSWTAGLSAQGRRGLVAVSGSVVLAWARSSGYPAEDERIFRSTDGGATWTDIGEPIPGGPLGFVAAGGGSVVASDFDGTMYRSSDAGLTWSTTFTSPGPRPSYFSSAKPVFADSQTGYFGYGAGFIIKTVDGGATWSQISSGSGVSLNDLDRYADGSLIAVGDGGTVLRSTGSAHWVMGAVSTIPLEAVQVIGSDAVVVDENGRVSRSTDGGATWSTGLSTPVDLQARDLDFDTMMDGWVVGSGYSGAALFHTANGGDSWTAVPGFMGAYVSVDFEGPAGWAANVGGIFQRTTDNGATWTELELPGYPYWIEDMDFYDVSVGYAAGAAGYAARSDDGGVTWEILPTPSADVMFTDIYLVGANELWLATSNNLAYYSATGGQNWAVLDIGSGTTNAFSAITATSSGDAWVVGDQGAIEKFTGPPPAPLNRPPVASFQFAPSGMTVSFTDTSTDPDGVIIGWLWDFGDSTTSTDQNPSHTYTASNTYIVRLTVTDDDSAQGIGGRFIVVQPDPGGTFGDFTEVTPVLAPFVTPQDEDFWVTTTSAADFDGDDDLDIAVLGYHVVYNQSADDRLILLRNNGPAAPTAWSFEQISVPLGDLSAGASDLAWGDADNDGDQDLALGTDGQTVLYRNDAGLLVLTDTVLPGYYEDNGQANFDLRSITWADYDNDGDLDLLIPSVLDFDTYTMSTMLMRNDGPNGTGGWSFTDAGANLAATSHAQSAWADFDNDHDLDLLLVNLAPLTEEGFIRRYRNDGGGVFVGEDILGALTVEHGEAQWGDFDDDGDFDLLVAGNVREIDGTYDQALRIYRNDAETYVPVNVIDCLSCEGWFDLTAATWADYDSDGDVDILLTGTYNSGSEIEGRAKIYANSGGVFSDSGNDLPAPRASGTRGGTFTWLDIDGELDLDYFIAGEYFTPGGNGLIEAQMHLYRNDAGVQNAAPSAPSTLTANVQGNDVQLSWTGASDAETPANALTYDLDVYDAAASVAAPRRLPEPGVVSAAGEWLLYGLPDGEYKWSLRAVDSAYNGGPAATGTFTVGSTSGTPVDPPRVHAFTIGPTPFVSSTWLQFDLPVEAEVDLAIYDVQGRLITRLAEGVRPAGVHSVTWSADGLSSGAYFARFATRGFTSSRRIVLVR
jgi:photosystem II stability/assembly factor-like uncharacterized protein